MGKPKAPTPPDPQETAGAQTAQNIGTAITQQQLNNVNQVTPYGTLTYKPQTNPNYNPNFVAPEIQTITTQQPGTPQTGGGGGSSAINFERGGSSTSGSSGTPGQSTTSYQVDGQSFDTMQAAQDYQNGLNPQSQTYSYTDPNTGQTHEIPLYTAVQELSPEQQAILDNTQSAQLGLAQTAAAQSGRLNDLFSNGPDLSGVPDRFDFGGISTPQYQRVGSGPRMQSGVEAGAIRNTIADAGEIERNIDNAGAITRSYGTDFSQDRQRVEDALNERQQSGLDRTRQGTEARLAAQGIRLGSEAYSAAQDDLYRGENDARLSSILAGGQEQSRMTGLEANRAAFQNSAQAQQYGQNANDAAFTNSAQAQQYGQNANDAAFWNSAQAQGFGQNMAQAGLANSTAQQQYQNRVNATNTNNQLATQDMNAGITLGNAINGSRSQALNEAYTGQNQELNQISTLLGGSQVQNPNFVNTPAAQLANTDYAGIVNNNFNQQMGNYNAQMGAWNGLMGGLGGLGSAAIMASDKRLKKDIKKVGKTDDGQQIYSYRYKAGGPIQMGLMAQEVKKKKPEAVSDIGGGMMGVNYGIALGGK